MTKTGNKVLQYLHGKIVRFDQSLFDGSQQNTFTGRVDRIDGNFVLIRDVSITEGELYDDGSDRVLNMDYVESAEVLNYSAEEIVEGTEKDEADYRLIENLS